MILITGGGTGGHIYPGIAIAHAFEAKGYRVRWLGAKHGLEKTLVPKANISIDFLNMTALRQGGLMSRVQALWQFACAIIQAVKIIKRYQPKVVIALGGYASSAGGLAAKLCGVPLILHEQNAAAGLSNKLLARFAKHIFLGLPGAFEGQNVQWIGNPVRDVFNMMSPPAERYTQRSGNIRILVLGGSQGARIFNETMPKALKLLAKDNLEFDIVHLSGEREFEHTKAAYENIPGHVVVAPFHHEIENDFAWADIVIARAGAMTTTEVAASGVACLFVPLAIAADDHQTKNAKTLVDHEAAMIMPQTKFTIKNLVHVLKTRCASRESLQSMAERAYALRPKDPEQALFNGIRQYL